MKLLIFDKVYVPGYGMGPFTTPIEIDDPRLLASLKQQSRIKVISDQPITVAPSIHPDSLPITIVKSVVPEVKEVKILEDPKESFVQKEIQQAEENLQEQKSEELQEEVKEAEEVEPENQEEVQEAIDYSEWTISELKAKLDEMGVPYLYKDTKTTLIEKIAENQ